MATAGQLPGNIPFSERKNGDSRTTSGQPYDRVGQRILNIFLSAFPLQFFEFHRVCPCARCGCESTIFFLNHNHTRRNEGKQAEKRDVGWVALGQISTGSLFFIKP